jgi:hypothetical protein
MPLGVLTRRWIHLAGVSGGGKIQLGSSIVMKIYPALSLIIGGRDGMDCRRRLWMTRSKIEHVINHRHLGIDLVLGDVGHYSAYIYIYEQL